MQIDISSCQFEMGKSQKMLFQKIYYTIYVRLQCLNFHLKLVISPSPTALIFDAHIVDCFRLLSNSWHLCSSGVGYTVILIALYVGFYYNVIIAWSLYYLFSSMTNELPWLGCGNSWNSENCTDPQVINGSVIGNGTSYAKYKITPAAEFYEWVSMCARACVCVRARTCVWGCVCAVSHNLIKHSDGTFSS